MLVSSVILSPLWASGNGDLFVTCSTNVRSAVWVAGRHCVYQLQLLGYTSAASCVRLPTLILGGFPYALIQRVVRPHGNTSSE